MAGFEVTLYGRIWVTPEVSNFRRSRAVRISDVADQCCASSLRRQINGANQIAHSTYLVGTDATHYRLRLRRQLALHGFTEYPRYPSLLNSCHRSVSHRQTNFVANDCSLQLFKGAERALALPPARFEAASIKPAAADNQMVGLLYKGGSTMQAG
jgi:hypothetical protein